MKTTIWPNKKNSAIIHRNTRKGAMKNDNGQQLSLTQALDLLKNKQGKNFKTAYVNLAKLERLTGILIDNLLRQNVTNSEVCFERVKDVGYKGGISNVKNYITSALFLYTHQYRESVHNLYNRFGA